MKTKLEFSKLIVIFISLAWLGSLIATYFKPEIQFILDYTNGAFMATAVSYAVKSGAENVMKIQNNGNENKSL